MPWLSSATRDRRVERRPRIRDVWVSQKLATSHIAAQAGMLSTINVQLIDVVARLDRMNATLEELVMTAEKALSGDDEG